MFCPLYPFVQIALRPGRIGLQSKMVYYFTSNVVSPSAFIYVGKDKFESMRQKTQDGKACWEELRL